MQTMPMNGLCRVARVSTTVRCLLIVSAIMPLVFACTPKFRSNMANGTLHVERIPQMAGTPIEFEVGSIETEPGIRIFYRVWGTPNRAPGPAVLVVPGIGYHSEPYKVVADYLSGSGHLIVAIDLRGHGRSGGMRAAVPTGDQLLADLDGMIQLIRSKYASNRVYLLGESMGGLVAINYGARRSSNIDGLILVAPAVRVACAQLLKAENLKVLAALLFQRDRPIIDLAGARLEEATVDHDFILARRTDDLAINKISVNYLLGLSRLQTGLAQKAAAIHVPTLVLHGKRDKILSWKGSASLHDELGSADKKLITFEEARHTLFWDPSTPDVFKVIRAWLQSHSEGS